MPTTNADPVPLAIMSVITSAACVGVAWLLMVLPRQQADTTGLALLVAIAAYYAGIVIWSVRNPWGIKA